MPYFASFYSGKVTRITPEDSYYSWGALAIDAENVLAGNYICKLALNLCIKFSYILKYFAARRGIY